MSPMKWMQFNSLMSSIPSEKQTKSTKKFNFLINLFVFIGYFTNFIIKICKARKKLYMNQETQNWNWNCYGERTSEKNHFYYEMKHKNEYETTEKFILYGFLNIKGKKNHKLLLLRWKSNRKFSFIMFIF